LLILEKDKEDARVTRLKLTENGHDFWIKIRGEGVKFNQTLFNNIDKDDLAVTRRVMKKMLLNINEIDQKNERGSKEDE